MLTSCANCAFDGLAKIVVEPASLLVRMPLEGTVSKAIIVCVSITICVTIFAACATGGPDGGGASDPVDAAVVQHDAANIVPADARTQADAGQDAQLSQMVDAGSGSGSSGPFCTTNSQCTVSGECCLTLGGPSGFCAPGTVVLGECFPE